MRAARPPLAFQSFTVPSSLAEAICRPSGLKATSVTKAACPRRTPISLPVAASQIRTALSSEAEAIRCAVGVERDRPDERAVPAQDVDRAGRSERPRPAPSRPGCR